jgi:hypothetical protein
MEIEKYTFQFNELSIRPDTLTHAIGYPPDVRPPEQLIRDIEEVLSRGKEICHIEGGYRIAEPVSWDINQFNMIIENASFHIKKIVFGQIKRSTSVAVFVCTTGHRISEEVKNLTHEGDMLKAYVYDTFGSIVVESAMDIIQKELQKKLSVAGLNITNRFSPGYCGWDVSEQKKLFSLLPEEFCGIELTDSSLMKPIKSVSGIIGIGPSVKLNPYTCTLCDISDCLYRNLHR